MKACSHSRQLATFLRNILQRDLSPVITTALNSSLSYHDDTLTLLHSEAGRERKLNKRGENWIFSLHFIPPQQNEFDDVRGGEGIKYISHRIIISFYLSCSAVCCQSTKYLHQGARKDSCDLACVQLSWEE